MPRKSLKTSREAPPGELGYSERLTKSLRLLVLSSIALVFTNIIPQLTVKRMKHIIGLQQSIDVHKICS